MKLDKSKRESRKRNAINNKIKGEEIEVI